MKGKILITALGIILGFGTVAAYFGVTVKSVDNGVCIFPAPVIVAELPVE